MAVTLNASTSAGLVQSADLSGSLNIQSNGTTVLGVTSTGIAVTGTQSVSGAQSVSGNLSFNSGYGSSAVAFGCRAWVNFDGTTNTGGFCTIRASGNVTSVADNGTGNYTINFTTALTDANYAGVFGCNDNANTTCMNYRTGGTKTTTAFQVSTVADGANLTDNDMAMVAVFR
jgi:hypothetical protein